MCLRLAICGFNVFCASFSIVADGTLVVAVIQSGKVSFSSWTFNDVPVGFNFCEGNNGELGTLELWNCLQ